MPTIPTTRMERELRKLYLQWLVGVPDNEADLAGYVGKFQADSERVISKLGGAIAANGALADFPAPKLLTLSPVAGVIYDDMKQAAIQASIQAGLNARDTARQMFNAGMDKSYRRLERLARTETVSAYWKNSWDSIADLPAIVMVWGSEESKRTCEYCLSRDGLVIEDGNIRDHPNGRCTPIPTLRSRVKYKGTLQSDGSVFMDPRWADQKVKGAKSVASAGPTTAEQRNPISGKSNPAAPSQAQAAQAVTPRPALTPVGPVPAVANGVKAPYRAEVTVNVESRSGRLTTQVSHEYFNTLEEAMAYRVPRPTGAVGFGIYVQELRGKAQRYYTVSRTVR